MHALLFLDSLWIVDERPLILAVGEMIDSLLISNQIPITGILCKKGLFLHRKLIVWHFLLMLKLEIGILNLSSVSLIDNVVDIINLRMVHLMV